MKVKVLITLCFGLCGGLNLLAQADEIINGPHVPVNVQKHYFKGEEEIQVTSPGLHIVDLRNQESMNTRTIIVSPQPAPATTNTVIKVPPVNQFQSNISPVTYHPFILPLGQSSRILNSTNIMKPGDILGHKSLSLKNKKIAIAQPETPVLHYNQENYATTGTKVLTINTEVSGKLKSKPGHLLKGQ